MTKNKIALAVMAGLIAAVGLFVAGYSTSSDTTAPQKCLYASVTAPLGKEGTQDVFNTTEACKGLSDAQKIKLSNHLADFMTAASK